MARPLKDKESLMNVRVSVMVTAEQRALLDGAAAASMMDLSAWVRAVLLEAAKKTITPLVMDAAKARSRKK